MASTRFGHLDDFTLKNTNVGIGTSTPQDKMEVIGGTRSTDLRVAGIATLTSAGGFIEKHLQYTEDQILFDTGDSGTLSGEVVVEESVYVGTGAKIINQLTIGNNTIVGAGAVVSKSLPEKCTAVGIPAKPIKFH